MEQHVDQAVGDPARVDKSAPATEVPLAMDEDGHHAGGRQRNGDSLVWTKQLTDMLFDARYIDVRSDFMRAKNNTDVKAAWIAVAKTLSTKSGVTVSSDQCRTKMKVLSKKWAQYSRAMRENGNAVERPIVAPLGLTSMQVHWERVQALTHRHYSMMLWITRDNHRSVGQ